MDTIKVYWKDKFNGALVTINAQDFDPAIHRHQSDGQWPDKQADDQKTAKKTPDKK